MHERDGGGEGPHSGEHRRHGRLGGGSAVRGDQEDVEPARAPQSDEGGARMKFYKQSRKAEMIKFADDLIRELNYYKYRGYEKIKIDKIVSMIQSRYICAKYERVKSEVLKALELKGIEFDDVFIYFSKEVSGE